ncbi:uncharacterized protein [Macrobrachium rosenbergii]|uniref:uncharacterized protein n=1 Tax=Macrobrachium rosenbergii TaxID=79674 RepID=UPI0034D58FAF
MWLRVHQNVVFAMLSQALILLPLCVEARFYIGRYKTVPVERPREDTGRSMPFIIYPDEEGNAIEYTNRNRFIEQPPIPYGYHHHHHFSNPNHRLEIGPPTLLGPSSTYGNNLENGYVVASHKDVDYVVPPFTPGGRVNVAFQFWIPISIGGFFVTSRDIEKALRSENPTTYIASLFLKHLTTNATASALLGDLTSPILEQSIQTFLDWAVPYLEKFAGDHPSDTDPPVDSQSKTLSRQKRNVEGDGDGWVTIGGGPHSSDLMKSGEKLDDGEDDHSPGHAPVRRVLWSDIHFVTDNGITAYDSDRRPDLDFPANDGPGNTRPRPFSSRPTPSPARPASSPARPSLSYKPSISSYPSSSDVRPPFHLTSFDDLPSGTTNGNKALDVSMRLSRLDYFFSNLHLDHEECRRRVLCEVAREPETFSPLSEVINGETKIPGDMRELSRELLNTAEGARLLSYIEAVKLGEDKSQQCDVHRYRCRTRASDIINTDVLPIWREVVRWLTVKVLTQDANSI